MDLELPHLPCSLSLIPLSWGVYRTGMGQRERSVGTTVLAQQIGNSGQASSGWNSVSSSPLSVHPQTDKRTKARKHTVARNAGSA